MIPKSKGFLDCSCDPLLKVLSWGSLFSKWVHFISACLEVIKRPTGLTNIGNDWSYSKSECLRMPVYCTKRTKSTVKESLKQSILILESSAVIWYKINVIVLVFSDLFPLCPPVHSQENIHMAMFLWSADHTILDLAGYTSLTTQHAWKTER